MSCPAAASKPAKGTCCSGQASGSAAPYYEDEENEDYEEDIYGGYGENTQEIMEEYMERTHMPSEKADTINELVRRTPDARATSYAGKEIFDQSGLSRSKFEKWVEKNTSWKRGDQTSYIGPQFEEDDTFYDPSDPQRRARGFDPYVHTYEMKKFASPYKDFHPPKYSTPYREFQPCATPAKAQNWKQQSIVAEPSFRRAASPCSPEAARRPKHNLQIPELPYKEDPTTAAAIQHVLGEMEVQELSRIKKDLQDFQAARRRLIYDATRIRPTI